MKECKFTINYTAWEDINKIARDNNVIYAYEYNNNVNVFLVIIKEEQLSKLMYFMPDNDIKEFLQQVGNRYFKW